MGAVECKLSGSEGLIYPMCMVINCKHAREHIREFWRTNFVQRRLDRLDRANQEQESERDRAQVLLKIGQENKYRKEEDGRWVRSC